MARFVHPLLCIFLLTACGGDGGTDDTGSATVPGAGGSSASGGGASGGTSASAGKASGGSVGAGSAGAPSAGAGGGSAGAGPAGAGGEPAGGQAGAPAGGSAGNVSAGNGGSAGEPAGGAAGAPVGGSSGAPAGGAGGAAGGGPCGGCVSDADCPAQGDRCFDGMCFPAAAFGECWDDKDCSAGTTCSGAFICPCMGACPQVDHTGKCLPPGVECCTLDTDCEAIDPSFPRCIGGTCQPEPPVGQCWTDADCQFGSCSGGSICPCGVICGVGTNPGFCEGTPPACCTGPGDCSANEVCVQGVCKQGATGSCWSSAECPASGVCSGAQICICGGPCDPVPDSPGACVPGGSGSCCGPGDGCTNGEACVGNTCKTPVGQGECWSDADCAPGKSCVGGFVCPCTADCDQADTVGVCK